MTNEFYNHDDGYPAFNAQGASSAMRAQFDKIGVAFDKFPALTGKASYVWAVNAGATAVEAVLSTGTGNVVRATDPTFTLTDTVTNNVSTVQHGWAPKLSGNAMTFLSGVGTWVSIAGNTLTRSARTSNTILAGADNATFIDITSGTFSQTFTAAATLANSWYCYIRNSGTGDITVDPNGAELIDGVASYVMLPNECRLVICDGVGFYTQIISPFAMTITANRSVAQAPGYNYFEGIAWSGAASGQRTAAPGISLGGPGGGAFPFQIPTSSWGATQAIVVGAGGAAVSGVANGNVGNDTTIGSFIVVKGASFTQGGAINGTQGGAGNANARGFESPTVNSGASYSAVWAGSVGDSSGGIAGGISIYGGGCGGSVKDGIGGLTSPGTSANGGTGGIAGSGVNGTAGTVPAGGGGASAGGTNSGAGARGEVRIWGVL